MSPSGTSLAAAVLLLWAMASATLLGFGLAFLDLGIPAAEFEVSDGLVWIQSRLLVLGGLQWLFFLPAALGAGKRLGYDRRSLGMDRPARPLHVAVGGVGLGAALLVAPGIVGRLTHGFVDGPVVPASVLGIVLAGVILAVMALGEEVLFRGILLRAWEPRLGTAGAVGVTTVLFVLLHGGNPGAGIAGGVGLALAGLLLGIAAVRTGSLWWPVGIHLGWNAAAGLPLGLPVSGISLPSVLRWAPTEGSSGLWGGGFGPEAGAGFHTALLVGIVIVSTKLGGTSPTSAPERES